MSQIETKAEDHLQKEAEGPFMKRSRRTISSISNIFHQMNHSWGELKDIKSKIKSNISKYVKNIFSSTSKTCLRTIFHRCDVRCFRL